MRAKATVCARCAWLHHNKKPNPKPFGYYAMHGAHIFSVGAWPHLADVEENIIGLDAWCHLEWAHREPKAFMDWLEGYLPNRLEYLRSLM